jgi:DNA-binding transcriptional MerR regulator
MLTGVSVRTLRHYITRGLLQPLALRGTATRYSRRELLRLLKMLQLKSESVGRVTLSALKRALDAHSNAELEAWVLTQRLSPELARALNSEAKVAPPGTGTFSASPALPADKEKDATDAKTAALERLAVETWHRIPLLPGLELMLSATASAAVQGVALRLYSDVMGPRPS